jgi:TfoX/Sxy family transcriptional regulator of competence genes
MSKAVYNPEIKIVLDQILPGIPDVTPGTMFGYPAYYFRDKMFACIYENGVGIKVPQEKAEDLTGMPGFSFFQPLGRAKMKSWIFLERSNPSDYSNELPLFMTSIEFVASSADKKKK